MIFMINVVACAAFAVIGFIIGVAYSRATPDGIFRIDVSDPKKDRYLLELITPMDELAEKTGLYFQVVQTDLKSGSREKQLP